MISVASTFASRIAPARRLNTTKAFSYGFSALTLGALLFTVVLFVWQSVPVWRHEGFGYLAGKRWFYREGIFGAAPMIYGTLIVSLIALLLAAPIGIGAGMFVAEYFPARLRFAAKITIELLAGVPSVVYGLLGILFLRDWIYQLLTPFDPLSGDTLLTAGVLLAVMVLPTLMTLTEDALRGVPAAQRMAARGLGLTRTEALLFVAFPQSRRGILAAVLLALGRALGETIAVFLVVGRQDNRWPENILSIRSWLDAGQTLTSKLGGSETNIAYGGRLHWAAVVGLGLLLLVIVALVTYAGAWLEERRKKNA
jgi:phosphate transport system permease protein